MKNVAVVGCGWLGQPLAVSLLKKKYKVFGTTTSIEKIPDLKKLGIFSFLLDFNKPFINQELTFLNQVDILVLNIPPSKIKGDSSYSEILLEFVKSFPNTIKVIFTSTTSVYPDTIEKADELYQFTEDDLKKETVQAEIKLRDYLKDRLTTLRLAGLIGLSRHPVTFLAGKKNIPNGNAPINLVHLEDVVGIIEKIISDNFWGEIINACYPFHQIKSEYYIEKSTKFDLVPPAFLNQGEKFKIVSGLKSEKVLNYKYIASI